MISKIRRLTGYIDMDGAVAMTVLTRVIQAGGGVFSVLIIAKFLSSDEQGYYYTFSSILAIQVFFELGLSNIITQYAAHEFSHLNFNENFELIGIEYYKSRLSSLLHFCVKAFAAICIVVFIVLMLIGIYFFSTYNKTLHIEWVSPWFFLCLTTSLNLFIDPILAFFEGIGEVKDIAKVRLIQKSFYLIFLFSFLLFGFKLYSGALASLGSILINYFQVIFSNRIKLLQSVWKERSKYIVSYYKEIFPFQWRIALSWISGYFMFQLFIPVLFATEGSKVAGQMGITLSILTGVSTLTMSWINTKVPLFSSLIAKKEYKELDKIFNATVRKMFIISVVLLALFFIFVCGLLKLHIQLGERFLPPLPLALMSLTLITNLYVYSWSIYLRCHKKDPYWMLSLVTGTLICLSSFFLGHKFGLYGIVIGYSCVIFLLNNPIAYFIFKSKKLKWH